MAAPELFQLRLGLIMKGGSSLAIYMNGMTQELLALVRASQARKLGKPDNSNPYTRILEELNIDVIIDVIAGTSAGGLNGLMLAKALACGSPNLNRLTELWQQVAQIGNLAGYDKDPKSVLSGDLLYEEMEKVMNSLSESKDETLADQVQVLDLFVTATDVHGHKWARRDKFNQKLEGMSHRYLFHLKKRTPQGEGDQKDRGYKRNDFMSPNSMQQRYIDKLLAKIGRATSAFPAVFPPIQIGPKDGKAAGVPIMEDIKDAPEDGIWFSDGGILVNTPIDPVLETIFKRSADMPVKRVLAFIEPDPETLKTPSEEEPSMVQTGLSAVFLPMQQDILESLKRLKSENVKREKLLEVVKELESAAAGEVNPQTPAGLKGYYLARVERLKDLLRSALDAALEGLKVPGPGDEEAGEGLGTSEEDHSPRGRAIKAILDAVPFPDKTTREEDAKHFLERLDIEYHSRRLHFLLARLHEYYDAKKHKKDSPISQALRGLWGAVEDWGNASWMLSQAGRLPVQPGRWSKLAGVINPPFKNLAEAVRGGGPAPDDLVKAVFVALQSFMTTIREEALKAEGDALNRIKTELPKDASAAGAATMNQKLLTLIRDQFDALDVVLFPLQTYGLGAEWDAPELIRFCPDAARSWVNMPGKEKLTGDALGHFGAFFEQEWRANDIMWGRLDCAEILTRMMVQERYGKNAAPSGTINQALTERRRQILRDFRELFPPDMQRLLEDSAGAVIPLTKPAGAGENSGAPALAQVAAGQLPAVADNMARMRDFLQGKDYAVGRQGIGHLNERRLAAEILMVLYNIIHALEKRAPASLQGGINKLLLLVLLPVNWMARLILLPRAGTLGTVQNNLIGLMTLLGGLLWVVFAARPGAMYKAEVIAVAALLFPAAVIGLFKIFRAGLVKVAAGVSLLALAGVALYLAGYYGILDTGAVGWLNAIWGWLAAMRWFWLAFAGGACGYLLSQEAGRIRHANAVKEQREKEIADRKSAIEALRKSQEAEQAGRTAAAMKAAAAPAADEQKTGIKAP